ncbi:SPT3 Dosage dependent suppressor of Ty-induced promoter mutations-like protein [Entomortierella chlamydospora]|uniref:SPT3 Dosage dependent suppressor of Ty-induced promoter mutations-like protein n=1 Tax=Entomortierella chlamydospora TaxID=101097 RepID=A0A9P6MTM9_9FUNG|nr:SPT3 Dosage dependent suppressor of Ty-induced promoter mutations-like protein [Entomortierella chlamydospora]
MVGTAGHPLVHQLSSPARPHDMLVPQWPTAYVQGYETKYTSTTEASAYNHATATNVSSTSTTAATATTAPAGLIPNNFYARPLHTPFYQMELPLSEAHLNVYASQSSSAISLFDTPTVESLGAGLPTFDVKAYTFRKKSRHYVAVKHRNALRIEPIIYLKTSILDNHREVVRNWDYLRIPIHRFRDNALPKKRLSTEEMRTARILDVGISLVSPNNNNRIIEDSCPACAMRMDGERKIMQVLAKNFKMTPAGEPVIDIRKGHAIVCIKINCYCDHHNEQDGFEVRMQTEPQVVRMGGSVRLRICCEARSKLGPAAEPEVEEEDGLTDIDAPISTGSRSPLGINDRSAQSPSLSYGSQSPNPSNRHQRQQSTVSSSTASPRSTDERERVISSLGVEPRQSVDGRDNQSVGDHSLSPLPPAFREIYPLTPSEGTCLGGTRVTIHGAHFDTMQNPVVYFGKVPAELVTISHHDVMECTTPPAEGLKPGIVAVRIATLAHPLTSDTVSSVDFMYMAPPDYDMFNIAATSLSYAMANEYPHDDSLAYILNAHGSGFGGGFGQELISGTDSLSGTTVNGGLAWSAKEAVVLDFLKAIQTLAPGRVLPSFQSDNGHTLLHLAAQHGMIRLAKELINMGIDHTAVDRNRNTALRFAQLTSNTEMAQLLSQARIPPRPMVPRTEETQLKRKEIVDSLIQKHETSLRRALAQEQERKAKELEQMRDRSLRIMELQDQTSPVGSSGFAMSVIDIDADVDVDIDGDEITDFSGESSPSVKSDEDELLSPLTEHDLSSKEHQNRKRKSIIDEPFDAPSGAYKKLQMESTSNRSYAIDPTQLAFIQNGAKSWENVRGNQLFGDLSGLTMESSDVQVWVCESAIVSTKASSSTSSNTTLAALALSASGLHLYTEMASTEDSVEKNLSHWSLVEIYELSHVLDNSAEMLRIDMCGLIPSSGRDLLGERIQVKPVANQAKASEILDIIENARVRLNEHQKKAKAADWMESRLRMWCTLFKVSEPEVKSVIDYCLEFKRSTLILKAADDELHGHSLGMVGAVVCMARDLDDCEGIQFNGAKVADNGWDRPELIKELEKTTRSMTQVRHWQFLDCKWTPNTVQGFVSGLKLGLNDKNKEHSVSKEICLTGNEFGGDDSVGSMLVGCVDNLETLKCLNLENCDIGLAGMKHLVHRVKGLEELRLRGNRVDASWWQWMDDALTRNPDLKKCSIGAPVPIADPDKSLVSLERLNSLKHLEELDLSGSHVTQPTLDALTTYIRHTTSPFSTLALTHCQLRWPNLMSIFKAVCEVNTSTKFTLNISQNTLFDSEAAIQDWERSVNEAQANVPFGIQMKDLLISDLTLQRILAPVTNATCFNEFNIKGLYIKRASQAAELDSLDYDTARAKSNPEGASEESCLALGRIISSNSKLIMLDVSGNLEKSITKDDKSNSDVLKKRAVGGFGAEISLAFPALAGNTSLRYVTIDYNKFGENGMIELSKALRLNRHIGVFSCAGNDGFTLDGLHAIESIFAPQPDSTTSSSASSEYNNYLSVWDIGDGDETVAQLSLMHMEVDRLNAKRRQIELDIGREQVGVKKAGEADLKAVTRRLDAAINKRVDYEDTLSRIKKAIAANNQRTREAHEKEKA